MMLRLVGLVGAALVVCACSSASPVAPTEAAEAGFQVLRARYRVVFTSTWSASTHPMEFPESAHYSGLIGGTHKVGASFWREGELASEGIRRMAERGAKSPLDEEVSRAIAAGAAEFLLSGPALATSPGSTSMEFDVSQDHPLVTLVTMIAPSPDWFVGVSGLALFANGRWIDDVIVELRGMDAGTDSGSTYSAPDEETSPRQPIARLGAYGGAYGTFRFERFAR